MFLNAIMKLFYSILKKTICLKTNEISVGKWSIFLLKNYRELLNVLVHTGEFLSVNDQHFHIRITKS